MSGFGRSWRVAVAVALPLMQPGAPDALLARSSLTPDVRDSAITLVDNTHEAVTEGLDGVRQGEDAASAEQVPAAEYSDTSPPPPGSTWAPEQPAAWRVEEPSTPEPEVDEPSAAAPSASATPEPEVDEPCAAAPSASATPEPEADEPSAAATPEPLPTPDPTLEPEPEPEPGIA